MPDPVVQVVCLDLWRALSQILRGDAQPSGDPRLSSDPFGIGPGTGTAIFNSTLTPPADDIDSFSGGIWAFYNMGNPTLTLSGTGNDAMMKKFYLLIYSVPLLLILCGTASGAMILGSYLLGLVGLRRFRKR